MGGDDGEEVSEESEQLADVDATGFAATQRLQTHLEADDEVMATAATIAGAEPMALVAEEVDEVPTLLTEDSEIEMTAHIDSGGLARVYLATQYPFERDVAVKFLRAERNSRENHELLLSEGVLTGYLDHPNIVPVYRIAETEDQGSAIVMKRIRGRSFESILDGNHASIDFIDDERPLAGFIRILIDVCHAVEFAHSRGIIHRDLKPQNIMVGRFADVYTIDWGLAVCVDEPECAERFPRPADRATPVGTPAYMAPEMVGGAADALSRATDQFLLGGILHRIIRDRPPYRARSIESVLAAAHRAEPKEYGEEVPSELAEIARRAMAREPEERFPSVSGFRLALEKFLEHQSSRRLAREASYRVEELRELITDADQEAGDDQIYRTLCEARYGFRTALDSWEGNAPAKEGFRELVELGVEWALTRGNPETAALFLDESPEAHPELRRRVSRIQVLADEQEFESLFFEKAPTALAVVNEEGRISHVNDRLTRLFGYELDQLLGEPIEMLLPERYRENHKGYRSAYQRAPTERPMGTDLELYALASDGGEFPVDIELRPVELGGERMVLASIVRLDEPEDEDEEEVDSLTARSVLRHLPQAVFVERDGEIYYANSRAVDRLGYDYLEALLGEPFDSVVKLPESPDEREHEKVGVVIDSSGERLKVELTVESLDLEEAEQDSESVRLVTAKLPGAE